MQLVMKNIRHKININLDDDAVKIGSNPTVSSLWPDAANQILYKIIDELNIKVNIQAILNINKEDMRKAFIAGGNSQIEEDDDYGTEYDAYMEEWLNNLKRNKL